MSGGFTVLKFKITKLIPLLVRNSVWLSLVGENFATLLNLDVDVQVK